MAWNQTRAVVKNGQIGAVTQKLYDTLTGIQWGREADPDLFGHVLCPDCQLSILKRYNRAQAADFGGVA